MTRERLRSTLREFDADWDRVAPAGSSVPAAWVGACPELSDAVDLPDVLRFVPRDPDAILLSLIRLHQAGDALAGRAVLQVMIPKAVRLALREREASLADILAALWERISTYPALRRPHHVAANLALDTLKAVVASRESVWAAPLFPGGVDDGPDAGAVLDAGTRLGVIDATTRRTLECVYVGGRSSRDAASELGMSRDVVRWRCSRGVRALRDHRDELVDDLVG